MEKEKLSLKRAEQRIQNKYIKRVKRHLRLYFLFKLRICAYIITTTRKTTMSTYILLPLSSLSQYKMHALVF